MPNNQVNSAQLHKSPLKWAGGKRRVVKSIIDLIPKNLKGSLIEPFVGGGSVFLNSPFKTFVLADTNKDLINFFKQVQNNVDELKALSSSLFIPDYNNEIKYYQLRDEFNRSKNNIRKAALFLYLNRHGYNGLCRYNKKQEFNVPFGRYKHPYFPTNEIANCHQKLQNSQLYSDDFTQTFSRANEGDVVYCDPPYLPISKTASFTAYSANGFNFADQKRLADCALDASKHGVTTIISNHFMDQSIELYKHANKIITLNVSRTISCKATIRRPIKELMAVYTPE